MPAPTALPRSLLLPQHWPAWLGLGLVWLAARLPYGALMRLGGLLGAMATPFLRMRGHVARRNLELCFPELAPAEREALLRETLRDSGRMLVEFALAWMGGDAALNGYQGQVDTYRDARMFDKAVDTARKAADANPKNRELKLMLPMVTELSEIA